MDIEKVSNPTEPPEQAEVISAEEWLRRNRNGDEAHDVLVYAAHGAGGRLASALMDVRRLQAKADRLQAEYDAALNKLDAYRREN